jgi:predicted TIM-barrel fold metal-dependent hydrolase
VVTATPEQQRDKPTGRRTFDAHLHIIDPRFPLRPNQGYVPEPFTTADYRRALETLAQAGFRVIAGAVVSGSFQADDQAYLRDALTRLGDGFVGVTQLPAHIDDAAIAELDHAGVRAARVNVVRGGRETLEQLEEIAHRVHDVAGWHVELYLDARDLPELFPTLRALPAVSIDHLGLHADGLSHLLELVAGGAKVKATGFGRLEFDPVAAMTAILETSPEALLVGTDLPSTRAPRPFAVADLHDAVTAAEALGGEALIDAVLYTNAAALYRLGP